MVNTGCSVCSSKCNKPTENNNGIYGHWVLDMEKFENGLNKLEPLEGQSRMEFQFGIKMLAGMFKNYYINFSEETFEEFNPMGGNASGKWKIEGELLIRDYDQNELFKSALDMMKSLKPLPEEYDDEKDYKNALENHEKQIKDTLKDLHQESPYKINGNELWMKVTSNGPGGKSIVIPFHLKRK